MKRLVAVIVLAGALNMASGAMAYGNGHNQPRDGNGKKYVERRDKRPEFGMWFKFPQPRLKLGGRHREWERGRERGRREDHRHNGCEYPRLRHRS
jgi:hypothetical protein